MTKGQKLALGITVGIPLLCLLGGFGIMRGLFGSAASARDRELALARAEGLPTTPAELSSMIHVPDAENAAPYYERLEAIAGDHAPLYKERTQISLGWSESSPPAGHALALAALPRLRPALDLVRQAVTLPHCDFHRNWAKGANLLFPEYGTMKALCRALCLEADVRSKRGDWRGALKDLDVAEHVSHQVREEPILIGLLVSISIEAVVQIELRKIVDEHSRDPKLVAAARRTLAQFGSLGDLRKAAMGELAFGRTMLAQVRSFNDLNHYSDGSVGQSSGPNAFEQGFFQSGIVRDAFDARLIRAYRRLISNLPPDSAYWEQTDRAAKKADLDAMADHSLASMGYQATMPVFSASAEAIDMQLARRNLADTALRLLEIRANAGKLPKNLPDFGPTRMDPFSGAPLVYRREGSGFIVYSFGRDRADHGGKSTLSGGGGKGFDEVFEVH